MLAKRKSQNSSFFDDQLRPGLRTIVFAFAFFVVQAADAASKQAPSCDGLFATETRTASAPKKNSSHVGKNDAPTSIGIVDTINSVFTGSQLYSVVMGESGRKNSQGLLPGLYRRDQRAWKLMLPGEIMVDSQGAPFITQLSLAKGDKTSYVVTVVNGNIHLLTGSSDTEVPNSHIQFGTKETPLYEIGTMQPRFLPQGEKESHISIFQDPVLTERGGQLVLVSLKFERPQAVGEGLTFAFEVLPNQANDPTLRLASKPIVLDYDYRDTKVLSTLVLSGSVNTRKKVLFSKILLAQFQNTELGFFESHLQIVTDWMTDWANRFLHQVSPSLHLASAEERVAYNFSTGQVEKDVSFRKIFREQGYTRISQNYLISRGRAELIIENFRRNEKAVLDAKLDLLPDGQPAIWTSPDQSTTVLSADGIFYALVPKDRRSGEHHLVKLGTLPELFPQMGMAEGQLPTEVYPHAVMSTGDQTAILDGALFLSLKGPNGLQMTGVVRLNLLLGVTLQKQISFPLLDYSVSASEISERIKDGPQGALLFDTVTPLQDSLAAYKQVYDPSRPHLEIYASSSGKFVYKFKQPSRTLRIVDNITYAEFSETPGVENPSGLYFNLPAERITGNEKDGERIVGQLLARPGAVVDQANPEKQYVFAKFEIAKKGEARPDDDYEGEVFGGGPRQKLVLLAADAKQKKGVDGYQLLLAVTDGEGKYRMAHLEQAFWRETFGRNVAYFQGATFVQGRREDRDSVYLFVSFAHSEGTQTIEKTLAYRINLQKPAEVLKVSMLDGVVLKKKDLQERIGFDDNGVPNFVMTPELNEEAHLFSVVDLKKGSIDFPNQNYGGQKKKYRFGEIKVSGGSTEDTYINSTDSWSASSFEVKKKYPSLGRSIDLAQFDSFVALSRQLDQLSQSRISAERVILVVPDSLRDLVWDFVLHKGFSGERDYTPGASSKQGANTFSHINKDLMIHIVDQAKGSQAQYLANVQNWERANRARPHERIFTLARMDEIFANSEGRPLPKEGTHAFVLDYVQSGEGTNLTQVATETRQNYPSALYLLASERPMPLREFRTHRAPPTASILIVATPTEMRILERLVPHEIENGLLDHYKIQEIKDPDESSMSLSLAEVFHNSDVQSLDYKFSAKEIKPRAVLTSDQSFEVVIDYAINRFASLLGARKESRFESFMRFRSAFAQAVLSDREVRKTRLINKYFIERVLTQVFDIPMNLATLPADDPMSILSRQDSLLLLQEAGYSGPFDLKARVRDTLLSQTRADASKSVPSSIMLFGNTGSGKTFLFLSLVKMLKLKLFDFNNTSNNSDASAIVINVGKLKENGGGNREGDMDVDQALAHLSALVSGPNGYRSWILLDDVHAASDAVKAKILNWQRSIFEAQDGMFLVTLANGARVRRPVRNLNIFMTLNPTADQDQIAKYAKDKLQPTQEEILLATLSSPGFKIEPSFLRRWGQIINLDYMPAGAKGPELLKSISKASNSLLNTMNRIVLVDPKVIATLVRDNETADARSFLSASTNALVEVASGDRSTGALVMVVPAMTRLSPRAGMKPLTGETGSSEKITNWILQNTRPLSLDSSLDGNLAFLKMIVDAFRTPIYESLTMALQEDPQFAASPSRQQTLLAPVLAAVSDHLQAHSYISIGDLNVNPSELGFKTPSERDLFRASIAKMTDPRSMPLFPSGFKIIDSVGTSGWKDIEGYGPSFEAKTRRTVLASFVAKNREVLRHRLSDILRVQDLDALPDPAAWLIQLSTATGSSPKEVGRQLSENLWQYLQLIFDPELTDNRTGPPLSTYAATRLYLYSIDRAIVQMSWVRPSKFLLKSLELITEDQVLSQKQGVQNFLFVDPQRLIKPTIPDFTFQIIASSHALEEIPQATRIRQQAEFARDVNQFFSTSDR